MVKSTIRINKDKDLSNFSPYSESATETESFETISTTNESQANRKVFKDINVEFAREPKPFLRMKKSIVKSGQNKNSVLCEQEVLSCIKNREQILDRLERLHFHYQNHLTILIKDKVDNEKLQDGSMSSKDSNLEVGSDDIAEIIFPEDERNKKKEHINRLICGLRDASLSLVESMVEWTKQMDSIKPKIYERKVLSKKGAKRYNKSGGSSNQSNSLTNMKPEMNHVFIWDDKNYLAKMFSDMEFIQGLPFISEIFGEHLSLHRNPFLLPGHTVDDFLDPYLNLSDRFPPTFIQVPSSDIPRIRTATFTIMSEIENKTKWDIQALDNIIMKNNNKKKPKKRKKKISSPKVKEEEEETKNTLWNPLITNQSPRKTEEELPILDDIDIDKNSSPVSPPKTESPRAKLVKISDISFIPLPFLVNVTQGSKSVNVSSFSPHRVDNHLKPADVIRIRNVHYPDNLKVSSDPSILITASEFILEKSYVSKMCVEKEADSNVSDIQENLKIWKLIPQKNDKRRKWRRQYDDGDISWVSEYSDFDGYTENFRIKIKWKDVEEYCRDCLCDPENSIHQQRVFYFEEVSILKIIEETFHLICQWHPVSNAIDNVKWSKLARKMRFLSKVKNSGHEVDMAFVRQIKARKERKLSLDMFIATLQDIALLQYPSHRSEPYQALSTLVWDSIVLLENINSIVWSEAKRIAVVVEGVRLCAQIRIASFYRRVRNQVHFFKTKNAQICISKYSRRMIAIRRKDAMLQAIRDRDLFELQRICAIAIQKTWRRYFQEISLRKYYESIRKLEIERIARFRSSCNQKRKLFESTIVFRRVQKIQGIQVLISMMFKDKRPFRMTNELEIRVYLPKTQRTFSFVLKEDNLRECMKQALQNDGPLSWNEMLLFSSLSRLTDRLLVKFVRTKPTVLFSKRGIAERGLLISKKVVKFDLGVFLICLYRSPFDLVVTAYDFQSSTLMRSYIVLGELIEWIQNGEIRQSKLKLEKLSDADIRADESEVELLKETNQKKLISWLMRKVNIVKQSGKSGYDKKILLQCEAEEDKKERIICKIQGLFRRKKSLEFSLRKIYETFEKAYDRESRSYYYINKSTGMSQWNKPQLLGREDIELPVDEWRRIEKQQSETDTVEVYYFNLATGQTSFFTEEEAAKIVQRKFRKAHLSDLLESQKMDLCTVARVLKFINDTKNNYSSNPHKISYQLNCALMHFCLEFESIKSGSLLKIVFEKSPFHPVISRSYAIFLLSTCAVPRKRNVDRARQLFQEANISDPYNKKFQIAFENFFHWSVLSNPNHPIALLNYALVYQYIFRNRRKAEKIYRRALFKDPSNIRVVSNFELFQQEKV